MLPHLIEARADRDEIRRLKAEVERLTGCLKQANAGFEEYERKFYLTTDRAERAEAALRKTREYLDDCLAVLAIPTASSHRAKRELAWKIRAALREEE